MKALFQRSIALIVLTIAVSATAGAPIHGVAASSSPASAQPAVKLRRTTQLGTILTDRKGMTLYYYIPDKGGKPTCTGGCAEAWPPALKARSTQFAKLSVSGKFGTVKGPAGGRQITYNGWPLYTFISDKKPGQTKGQGLESVWFVATPKLERAAASTSPAPSATATCTPSYYGC